MSRKSVRSVQAGAEDARILLDVRTRLAASGAVDASELDVTVENGVVTLSGVIDDPRGKYLAADIADSILGVRDVVDQVRVRFQPSDEAEREEDTGLAGVSFGAEAARAARPSSS